MQGDGQGARHRPGWRLRGRRRFGANLPAQEIGGDYYDWVAMHDDTLAVALGDVSGKGVAAALLMSHLRASFHAETRGLASPKAVSEAMHESLYRATRDGRFATFFLARVPRDGGPLRFCNAGHNPGCSCGTATWWSSAPPAFRWGCSRSHPMRSRNVRSPRATSWCCTPTA